MNINSLKKLLEDIANLPKPELPEQTMLSIGGRGYYENPTTDVLAFFCDSEGAHNLGSLMNEAIFDSIDRYSDSNTLDFKDGSVIAIPKREVSTKHNKRIDLLVEGDDWIMIIENKIYHTKNNPFSTYESYIQTIDEYKDKQHIYIVLSPRGSAPDGWISLTYPQLLGSLKEKLASAFIDYPLNKWLILLREFILHLENLMTKPSTPTETLEFVLDNLNKIKRAQDLKQNTINSFQKTLLQRIKTAVPDKNVTSDIRTWSSYPSIRFRFEEWNTNSFVSLFLDARKNHKFCINYYAYNITDDQQQKIVDEYLMEEDCSKSWYEGKGKTIRCYKAPFLNFSEDIAVEKLLHKLNIVDRFETEVRAQM